MWTLSCTGCAEAQFQILADLKKKKKIQPQESCQVQKCLRDKAALFALSRLMTAMAGVLPSLVFPTLL